MAAWDKSRVATHDTLCAVLKEFREKGVQGVESAQRLTEWLTSLTRESLKEMCEIDKDATLQILVDCYGVGIAFHEYIKTIPEICKQDLTDAGYLVFAKAEIESEMAAKRKRIEQLEADYIKLTGARLEECKRNETLEKENAALKIALFDAYVAAGQIKIPGWEEGRN